MLAAFVVLCIVHGSSNFASKSCAADAFRDAPVVLFESLNPGILMGHDFMDPGFTGETASCACTSK